MDSSKNISSTPLLSQEAETITMYIYWSMTFQGFCMHIDIELVHSRHSINIATR